MFNGGPFNDLRSASSQGDRSQGQSQQRQGGGFGNCAGRRDQGAANTEVHFPIGKRTDTRVTLPEEEVGSIDDAVGVEVAFQEGSVDDKIVKMRKVFVRAAYAVSQEGKSVGAEAAGVFQRC